MSDLHFDRALRAAARRGRPDGVCPDAAALASYVDRSLSTAELAALESHVASCPSCIEHLALLAAVDTPETPAEGLGGLSFAQVFGHWRWLVPVATAVLVVAIWLRVPSPREAAPPPPASAHATAVPADAPEAPAPSHTPAREASAGRVATAGASADKPAKDQERADAFADSRARLAASSREGAQLEGAKQKPAEEVAQAQAKTVDALAEKERDEKRANERQKMVDVAATAPAVPAANAAKPTLVAEAKADADASAGARSQTVSTPPAAEAVTIAPAQQGAVGGAMALRKAAVVSPLVITGPGVRVRVVGGRLERSTDEGTTWTVERTAVTGRMLSGSCPTSDACWVGGDDGAVFVRVADRTWIERHLPAVHVPILAITATSADAATLTLADGRRLATADGGRSWTPALP